MDPSSQADAILGMGRGALITAMFGSGWLGWGWGMLRHSTDSSVPRLDSLRCSCLLAQSI